MLVFVLSFAAFVYSEMATVAVSPFVNRGLSYTLVFSFFLFWDNNYGEYSDYGYFDVHYYYSPSLDYVIPRTEMSYRNYFASDNYLSLGITDRVEIEMALGVLAIKWQIKINVFRYENEPKFFHNFSISPFFGQYYAGGVFFADYNYDAHGGISVGTKHFLNGKVLFELYSSPLIYKSRCVILPHHSINKDYAEVKFFTLNIPIGLRMFAGNIRKFSCELGIIPIIHLKDTWIKTSPVAVFTKTSFHLGRKRHSQTDKKERSM
jgi:hypothetical protein